MSVPICRENLSIGTNHVFAFSVEMDLTVQPTLPSSLQLNVQSWLIHTTPKSSAFLLCLYTELHVKLFSGRCCSITGATCMLSLKTLLKDTFSVVYWAPMLILQAVLYLTLTEKGSINLT